MSFASCHRLSCLVARNFNALSPRNQTLIFIRNNSTKCSGELIQTPDIAVSIRLLSCCDGTSNRVNVRRDGSTLILFSLFNWVGWSKYLIILTRVTVKHCIFSPRRYIGIFREETLLSRLKDRLSTVKTHNFETLSLEPNYKDGGVFVKFKYDAGDRDSALATIENDLRQYARRKGGLPSWLGLSGGNIWLVKGHPWREVSNA